MLLNAKIDINAPLADEYGKTALQITAGNGNLELYQILLNAGINVNAPSIYQGGRTAL
jgi:ankyrin repeat protein